MPADHVDHGEKLVAFSILPSSRMLRGIRIHHRRKPQPARADAQFGETKLFHHRFVNRHSRQDDIRPVLRQPGDLPALRQWQRPEPLQLPANALPAQARPLDLPAIEILQARLHPRQNARRASGLSGLTCSMSPKTFKDLVMNMFIGCIVNPLIPVLIGIAVLFFIWGAFKFTIAEGDEKKKSKDYMVWGIVGLFIMVSLQGIVNILEYTFKLDTSTTVTPRSFNLQNLVKIKGCR